MAEPVAELEVLPPHSDERKAAKQAIKLAFISGSSTLASLAVKYRIPYATLMNWSAIEKWKDEKGEVAMVSAGKTVENVTDWIAEQRTVQIKRSLLRAGKLQQAADVLLPDIVDASELQAIASAEERADNIIRRNLGMDQQHAGGNSVSINILAGGVQLS